MTLDEVFEQGRRIGAVAFYNAFAREGYDPEELAGAPKNVIARCFEAADKKATEYLETQGAMKDGKLIFAGNPANWTAVL